MTEMEDIMKALDNDNNEKILHQTSESIFNNKYNTINELDLEEEIVNKFMNSLENYILVDELCDLYLGSFVKWIPLYDSDNIKLTLGGIVTDITIGNNSPIIKCKNFKNKHFAFDFNKSIVFRKITNQENVLLSVSNFLNK